MLTSLRFMLDLLLFCVFFIAFRSAFIHCVLLVYVMDESVLLLLLLMIMMHLYFMHFVIKTLSSGHSSLSDLIIKLLLVHCFTFQVTYLCLWYCSSWPDLIPTNGTIHILVLKNRTSLKISSPWPIVFGLLLVRLCNKVLMWLPFHFQLV